MLVQPAQERIGLADPVSCGYDDGLECSPFVVGGHFRVEVWQHREQNVEAIVIHYVPAPTSCHPRRTILKEKHKTTVLQPTNTHGEGNINRKSWKYVQGQKV